MSQIVPFKFHDHDIRIHIDTYGNPWWEAQDVCVVLGINDTSKAVSRLKSNEKRTATESRNQLIINEKGLYRLIMRSNKPEAESFQDWVFGDVLPSLRKHGQYSLNSSLVPQPPKDAPSHLTDAEHAQRDLAAWLSMSQMLGAPIHIAQIEAVKSIAEITGINLKPLLLHAPAQRNIPDAEVMLEPTSLGKALGYKNGHEMNLALESLGWQVRDDGGEWAPTGLGQPYAIRNSWVSRHSSKAGYNWRWNRAAVAEALERMKRIHG